MPDLHAGGQRKRTTLQLLYQRDGPYCWRCGGWIDRTLSGNHPRGGTIGHRVALAGGGTDDLTNLAPEHSGCNLNGTPLGDPAPRIAQPTIRNRDARAVKHRSMIRGRDSIRFRVGRRESDRGAG